MRESIIIIGAGMGGLSAGIYGQANGYETQIFEMHAKPGGQCASWKRKGYTFDACIHHFFGCRPGAKPHEVWQELGAFPRKFVPVEDCTAVAAPDGKIFVDYYDLEKLRGALLGLSSVDAKAIDEYIGSIKRLASDTMSRMIADGPSWRMLLHLPSALTLRRWLKTNMAAFAERFSDPFLRKAMSLLVYSMPDGPYFFHLVRHAGGLRGDIQWPAGGASEFTRSIEQRYLAVGGRVHYGARVEKILVENDRAVGIRLADGSEHRADVIISNADGRKTILEMLEGKYTNEVVRGYCAPNADETPFAVDVFLGVNRDLSGEPSSLILLLEKPVTMAGHTYESIEVQIYGFDPSMAPAGKGTIKVELPASYARWKQLYDTDKERYEEEKRGVAEKVVAILEGHFPGIKDQVEVVDVTTLMTWERFMGGTQGWFNLPNRKMEFISKDDPRDRKFTTTLPGLSNFYFVGVWASAMGSLFDNAKSGRTIIRRLCRKDGREFRAPAQAEGAAIEAAEGRESPPPGAPDPRP
jgi:phytoene dehydrogenase-like protein